MINKLVLENLKHRPIRTFLTVFAIGIQVTLMLTLVGLSRGMIEASKTRQRGVGADIMMRPPGTSVISLSSAPMPEKLVSFVQKQPHVAIATGTVIHPIGGLDTITGVDMEMFTRMSGGFGFLEGGPFEKSDDVLIDDFFARQKQWKIGDRVTLANRQWTVRGIVQSGKLSHVFVQLPVLQELTANTGRLSQIYIKADDPRNIPAVVAGLKKLFPDNPIFTMEEFLSQLTVENVPGLSTFINVIIGLSVIFGFLVVFLALYTAVLERTREIGILKALGAGPAYVLGLLLRETALLALIGAVFGIGLSFAARWSITTFVPASLPVAVVPEWWWRAALVALAGGMLGAIYPGMKAARQDAIEALAYE